MNKSTKLTGNRQLHVNFTKNDSILANQQLLNHKRYGKTIKGQLPNLAHLEVPTHKRMIKK